VHARATSTCNKLRALTIRRPRARVAVTILTVATTILLSLVIVRRARSRVLASSNSVARGIVVVDAVRACPTILIYKRDTASIVPKLTPTVSGSLAVSAGDAI
jgi:hypothetical protein